MNVTPDESDAVVRSLPLAVEGPEGSLIPYHNPSPPWPDSTGWRAGSDHLRRGRRATGGRFIPTREDWERLEAGLYDWLGTVESGPDDLLRQPMSSAAGWRPGEAPEGKVVWWV